MRRTIAVVIALLLLSSGAVSGLTHTSSPQNGVESTITECSFPFSATDATGTEVTVDQEPERIVTLAPSAAQTMWEIGGKEKVVGVSQFATFLNESQSRTTVTAGFPSQVNVEEVISLNPDLVLAPNTTELSSIKQLRGAGITVYHVPLAESFEDIYEKTERFGSLTGQCEAADTTVEQMKTKIQTVESAVSSVNSPRSIYELGNLIAAGPDTFIGKVLAKAGTTNIVEAASSDRSYPQLTSEFVIEQDPAYIVTGVAPEDINNDPAEVISEDSVLRKTTAWENQNVIMVDRNSISQPAPRIIEPMVKIVKAVHPEAYKQANLGALVDEDEGQPERVSPTSYSSSVLSNGSARLNVQLNYFEEETADFRIPGGFEENHSVQLHDIKATPKGANWNFGVEVATIPTGPTLPPTAEPLTGYQFTPHGMWPDDLERLNVSVSINTTQADYNATTAEFLGYTRTDTGWTAIEPHMTTSNQSIVLQTSLSTYQPVYFAVARQESTTGESEPATTTTTAPQTTSQDDQRHTTPRPTQTEQLQTTETTTVRETAQPPQSSSTQSTTVPGFGVVLTVVAIVATLLVQLARRP